MIGEQETGPLTRVELGVELASGSITPNSLVWKEGMIKWLPGARVPELESLFKNPPRSPRAAGSRPPPPPKKQEKGSGLSDFDTAHFRLADAQPVDGAQGRALEFDTGHFKLADMKAEESGQNRQMEFDTSHFKLADMKGAQGARALVPKRIVPKGMDAPEIEIPRPPQAPGKPGRNALKQASTAAAKPAPGSPFGARNNPPPVATPRPAPSEPRQAAIMSKGTSRPAGKPAAAEEEFDPNRTSVDFRTLGALVHHQNAAQALFESELVPAEAPIIDEPPPDPQVAELSKWAAAEMQTGAREEAHPAAPKKKAAPPPPVPLPPRPEKSWIPTAIAIAGALALVAALAWYFIAD